MKANQWSKSGSSPGSTPSTIITLSTAPITPSTVTPSLILEDQLLTIDDLAKLLQCKPAAIHNLTRARGQKRYRNPLPFKKFTFGIRFRLSDVNGWIAKTTERIERVA